MLGGGRRRRRVRPRVGARLLRVVQLEQRASQLERDREASARAAVADERARVARELHDVVAHSVSVMVIQAGAALHTLKVDDVDTAEALGSIETTGRQALVELRHMLGILRRGDEPALTPMPGIAQVNKFSEQMGEAGLPVDVRVEGQPAMLPPGSIWPLTGSYKRHSLTDTLKHAGLDSGWSRGRLVSSGRAGTRNGTSAFR